LFEACRVGLLPRVQRRLSEKERMSIKSGSVFVWDEREAGMRRWTDGKSWSASRVSGSFLTYREMEGKRGGTGFAAAPKANRDGLKASDDSADDGPDGYRYKPDGLMKQSFSITTSAGQHLHLISYFARSSVASQGLQQPSSDAQLRHIRPEKGMYPESTIHEQNNMPAITRGPMSSPAFAPSPHQSAAIESPYGRGMPHPNSHPSHYPLGYGPPGWAPPSPMHTPPPYSPYYHHGVHPHPHPHPHPATPIGQSPMQHMHNMYSSHPHSYPPPPTAFDRAPAPLSNTALPPRPQQHLPPQQSQPSHYMPPIQKRHSSHSIPHSHSLPSVSNPGRPIDNNPPRPLCDSRIDPSLSAPPRHAPTDTGAQSNGDQQPSRRQPTSSSSATTIPSISTLISETSGSAPPVHPALRTASPSSNNSQPRGVQDIPIHKIGYDSARDVQALRHLDKATLRY